MRVWMTRSSRKRSLVRTHARASVSFSRSGHRRLPQSTRREQGGSRLSCGGPASCLVPSRSEARTYPKRVRIRSPDVRRNRTRLPPRFDRRARTHSCGYARLTSQRKRIPGRNIAIIELQRLHVFASETGPLLFLLVRFADCPIHHEEGVARKPTSSNRPSRIPVTATMFHIDEVPERVSHIRESISDEVEHWRE